IATFPSLLEPISLVFVCTLDLFFTRVAILGTFDILSDPREFSIKCCLYR
ncbi:hypothetical protein BDR07DRAFT_1314513, partial [Suillus spraguei]